MNVRMGVSFSVTNDFEILIRILLNLDLFGWVLYIFEPKIQLFKGLFKIFFSLFQVLVLLTFMLCSYIRSLCVCEMWFKEVCRRQV